MFSSLINYAYSICVLWCFFSLKLTLLTFTDNEFDWTEERERCETNFLHWKNSSFGSLDSNNPVYACRLQSSLAVDTVCVTVEDYSGDFVHLKPAYYDQVLSKARTQVAKDYIKAMFTRWVLKFFYYGGIMSSLYYYSFGLCGLCGFTWHILFGLYDLV
jgi:hypothetical protein